MSGNFQWYQYGNFIGDPSKQYTITIPDHRRIDERYNWHCHQYSANLHCIVSDALNVNMVVDHDRIMSRAPESSAVFIPNKNQSPASFFMLNDQVFMFVNTDCPQSFAEQWIPYYSKLCVAFFVMQYRLSTLPLFEACPVPVFPLPMKFHPTVPSWYLERQSRLSLGKVRDIPFFFSGRCGVRARRREAFKQLSKHFPNAVLNNSDRRMLSSRDYCDYMCRSKIAWCPRSVYCNPDHEENGITSKECDAMCAQSMVIRHALHVRESEPRLPGVHFVEITREEPDLIEKLHYYLNHDDEREEIAYNGRNWYERNWAPTAQAHYIINRCLEAMGEPFEPWPH